MYSTDEFAVLEIMCREQATLAKKEKEFAEAEYWLAEAKEWKQLKNMLGALGKMSTRPDLRGPSVARDSV
jgi:hypothetical protein